MPAIGGLGGLPAMAMPSMATPVSATVYQNNTGTHLHLNLICSVFPTALLNSAVVVEVTGDTTWTEVGRSEIPAGGIALAGLISTVPFCVPSGYSYRVTLTRATAISLIAVG